MQCSPLPRLRSILAALFLLSFAILGCIPSASAAALNRIAQTVSGSGAVEIPDSIHPKVRLATDLGPTAADTPLVGMTIRFNMTLAQQAALDQLLADQQNPASPRYHQWLTPTQFGAQFGLSSDDLAKVTVWLTNEGFTVTGVANGGTFVTFDGTVAQAEAAFSTSIHNLSLNGETHYANITNASVPAAIADVVSGITGLHNFTVKPHIQASLIKPDFTSSIAPLDHFLAPGDIYTIYDVGPLLTAGLNGAGIGTGANCHSVPAGTPCGDIAITGAVDITTSDVSGFRSASGLSTTNLPTTLHIGGDPGGVSSCNFCYQSVNDFEEASLDVEWSGAMAPSASILFVNGPDPFNNAMTGAIDDNLAPIVTTSFGECEAGWGSTELNSLNQLFKQANAQGQTVLAASADSGATDCDGGTSAIEGLAVDFPASSPYVTGMGGTELSDGNATGATQYWNSNSLSTVNNSGSAIGYIPEMVWNDDSFGGGFHAGGGGPSAFFTKPAWQVEAGPGGLTTTVAPDASRDVPDISLDASNDHDPYLFCYLGSCANGFSNAISVQSLAGGTSFDSQIFGGMLALIEQKTGGRMGNINPTIYALGDSATYYNTTAASVFHDVTAGNNANPCTPGSIECPAGASPTLGFSAAVGYDLATGWGSVDLNNLANAWTKVTPNNSGSLGTTISYTGLTASSTSIAAGGSITLTATVVGPAPGVIPTPTGTVQFLVNNAIVGSGTLNSSGVATYSYTTSCSSPSQLVLSASYSGDATYAGSRGPEPLTSGNPETSNGSIETLPLTVSITAGACPTFAVSNSAPTVNGVSAISVAAGGTIPSFMVTVAPVNGYSGTVVLSSTVTSTSGYLPVISISPGSVNVAGTASATASVSLSGITAELRMPGLPGQGVSGTMYAGTALGLMLHGRESWYAAGSGVAIASLLLLVLPRRRRLGGLLMALLTVAIAFGASGCSTNSVSAPSSGTNPYIGTYVVTITGTATISGVQTSNSTTVTFNIE